MALEECFIGMDVGLVFGFLGFASLSTSYVILR